MTIANIRRKVNHSIRQAISTAKKVTAMLSNPTPRALVEEAPLAVVVAGAVVTATAVWVLVEVMIVSRGVEPTFVSVGVEPMVVPLGVELTVGTSVWLVAFLWAAE